MCVLGWERAWSKDYNPHAELGVLVLKNQSYCIHSNLPTAVGRFAFFFKKIKTKIYQLRLQAFLF
jgi:hypothetical protein